MTSKEQVSLKEHLNSRLCALEKAVDVAKKEMDRRLEGMNHLESKLNVYMTKESYETKHELIQRQVDELRIAKAVLDGKASQQSVNVAMIVSIISLLLTLGILIVHIIK